MPSYVIGLERGQERGERHGLERGRAVEKRLIVRRLLTRMDVPEVAGLLGLSPDEVARIVREDDGSDSA
jgi:predicted transposase YdaD